MGISRSYFCGSDFVKEGIAACGGPVERCAIVPFGADGAFTVQERSPTVARCVS